MDSLIDFHYKGIKCDNPECNWADWSVKQEDYEQWIDRPCPICGQNLLTKECHERTNKILEELKNLNNLLNLILPEDIKEKAKNDPNMMEIKYKVEADGTSSGEILSSRQFKRHVDIKV